MKEEQLKESLTKAVHDAEFLVNDLKEATKHSDPVLHFLLTGVLRESTKLQYKIEQIRYAVIAESKVDSPSSFG